MTIVVNNKYLFSESFKLQESVDNINGKMDYYFTTKIVPYFKKSRNGVMYTKESVENTKDMLIGKHLMYNHRIDTGDLPNGEWVSVESKDDGLYGKALVYNTNYNKDFIEFLKAAKAPRVSLQIMGQAETYNDNDGQYQLAYVNDWLEASIVAVAGFDDARGQSFEYALAEAYNKETFNNKKLFFESLIDAKEETLQYDSDVYRYLNSYIHNGNLKCIYLSQQLKNDKKLYVEITPININNVGELLYDLSYNKDEEWENKKEHGETMDITVFKSVKELIQHFVELHPQYKKAKEKNLIESIDSNLSFNILKEDINLSTADGAIAPKTLLGKDDKEETIMSDEDKEKNTNQASDEKQEEQKKKEEIDEDKKTESADVDTTNDETEKNKKSESADVDTTNDETEKDKKSESVETNDEQDKEDKRFDAIEKKLSELESKISELTQKKEEVDEDNKDKKSENVNEDEKSEDEDEKSNEPQKPKTESISAVSAISFHMLVDGNKSVKEEEFRNTVKQIVG